jgi:hypothetical protein
MVKKEVYGKSLKVLDLRVKLFQSFLSVLCIQSAVNLVSVLHRSNKAG